jgi:hypothetical protein
MAVEKSSSVNLVGPNGDDVPQLRATYTNSTNFTVPSTVGIIYFVLAGGGGAGGTGSEAWQGGSAIGGGGGGGGGVAASFIPTTPGETVSVTIGAGSPAANVVTGADAGTATFGGTTILKTSSWVAYAYGGGAGRNGTVGSLQGGQPGSGGYGARTYTNVIQFLTTSSISGSPITPTFTMNTQNFNSSSSPAGATSGTAYIQFSNNAFTSLPITGHGTSIVANSGSNDITSGLGHTSMRGQGSGLTGGGGGGSGGQYGGAARGGNSLSYTGGSVYAGFLYGGGGGGAGIAGAGGSVGQVRAGGAGGLGGGGGGGGWSGSTTSYRPAGKGGDGGVGAVLIYY